LPAYIGWSPNEGSGVFDPVQASGRHFDFYGLDGNLSIDVDDMATKLETRSFRFVVIIHYFGRTQPDLLKAADIARVFGTLVVEDLAHAFFTARNEALAGTLGNVLLYSLHKQFPLPSGGMAAYRDPGLVQGQASTRADLAESVLAYDWPDIIRARRRNFQLLTRHLQALPGYNRDFELLWPDLDPFDVPQSLPLRITRVSRYKLYQVLNDRGIGAISLYHTLIESVRGQFPVLDDLSRQILNLPVHQDVSAEAIPAIAEEFGRALKAVA
jgi:dTDP-4-amino-4,6-dideoxygalactose transaminase